MLKNVEYVLACTSTYPTPAEEVNLKYITTLKQRYPHLKVGFSDHSSSMMSLYSATALEAEYIEFLQNNNAKNFTSEERKFETKIDIKVLGYLVGEGDNAERPKFSVRESAAEVRFQRERTIFGDTPEYSGDGKLRGENPYSSDRTGYIE